MNGNGNGRDVVSGRQLTYGSVFSGIGGIDLGFDEAGMKCAWQCEVAEFQSKILKQRWGVPNHGDITKVDWQKVQKVDLLCGGFPCQDISQSSATKTGLDGERSGLWAEYERAIRHLMPRIVVVENVDALRLNGLGRVLRDLALLRYDAQWSTLSSCTLGATHMRRRMFIVAYSDQKHGRTWLGNFKRNILREAQSKGFDRGSRTQERILSASRVDRSSDGVPNRHDRVGALGNAVDVRVAELIGRAIMQTDHPLTPSSPAACGG